LKKDIRNWALGICPIPPDFFYLTANDFLMTQVTDPLMVKEWLHQKLDLKTITDRLSAMGFDTETIEAYVAAHKKLKRERKQTTGFVVAASGALLGFISCVLSLTNPIPSLYDFILFGVTSVAILLIVAGMYLIFE
jgi:hypothetical protein